MVRRKYLDNNGISDPIQARIEAELVKRDREVLPNSFKEFVKAGWHQVEEFAFRDGWHVDAICDHLQACAERRIKDLVINISPRIGKSTLTAVLYPAWVLARNPSEILLFSSYSSALAIRDSVKCRNLVESDWYKARFPHVQIQEDSNLKTAWLTTAHGGRQTTSVGGTVTGLGGTILICDDPLNASKAESVAEREKANTWYSETWSNRIAGDPTQAISIVIMQRLHANDVSNLCINDMGYEKLVIPMEYEGDKYVTSIGWSDPRTEPGELMWPQMWDQKTIDKQKNKARSYAWAGQYQQRPAPRGGGLIKKKWLKYWYDPSKLDKSPQAVVSVDENGVASEQIPQLFELNPSVPHKTVMTVDAAFKGEASSDYTVIQIWTKIGSDFYLLDQVRERMDFVATLAVIKHLNAKWNPLPTLIEDKANGSAIISSLKGEIGGVIPIQPQGGKLSRMSAISPLIEAGNVVIPHPDMFSWVEGFVDELIVFPQAPNDDQCDAMSQFLNYAREKKTDLVDVEFMFPSNHEKNGADSTSALVQENYWDSAN